MLLDADYYRHADMPQARLLWRFFFAMTLSLLRQFCCAIVIFTRYASALLLMLRDSARVTAAACC